MVVVWKKDAQETPLPEVLTLYLSNFPHPKADRRKLFISEERLHPSPGKEVGISEVLKTGVL